MQIHNIRLGFATNSSSSHSIVIIPGGAEDDLVEDQEFGWDYFTAGSKKSKHAYLAHICFASLQREVGHGIAQLVMERLFGDVFNEEGHIDHESCFGAVSDQDGMPHPEFVRQMTRLFAREDVVILGGNDNDTKSHPLLGQSAGYALPQPLRGESCGYLGVGRYDEQYDYWTVFHRETGHKLRFSLTPDAPKPTKATSPELVDLKITDYCEGGCAYCYQDSGREGQHAKMGDIESIRWALKDAGVFEVALGGGEPTTHPKFHKILRNMSGFGGLVPNFTTRNLDWMYDQRTVQAVKNYCGRFAYSAQNSCEVSEFIKAAVSHGLLEKSAIQIALGTVPVSHIRDIIVTANLMHVPVTILGFKECGRAKNFSRQSEEGWLDEVKQAHEFLKQDLQLGVDTVVVREYEPALQALGISDRFYDKTEGEFSMYLDAVDKRWGPSSYEETSELGERTWKEVLGKELEVPEDERESS